MLKLTKHLYISTITSLRENDMLKIDVSPGEYKLTPFYEGYVFTKTAELQDLELIKVFSTRDGDKGLSGTYYDGESDDPNQLRLFKTWLYKRYNDYRYDPGTDDPLDYDSYESEDEINERVEDMKRKLFKYDEYEARTFNFEEYNNIDFYAAEEHDREEIRREWKPSKFKSFRSYHNLPFIFYLNKKISCFDLIQLEEINPIENCGYLWKVNEGNEHIGYVVENQLHCMMGDQAGIAMFEGALAFGNFNNDYFPTGRDSYLYEARYGYKCCFDNCECDTQYSEVIERNKRRKLKLAAFKSRELSHEP